jgi:uncharacterized membrane protein
MNRAFIATFVFLQESAGGLLRAPNATAIEPTIINLVSWLRLLIETASAVIIGIGVLLAIYQFSRVHFSSSEESYTNIRLLLARYLALALEFQLGADILSTAIAPSWDQIGKLGAIAVIRTALNYFLSREMQQERAEKSRSDEMNAKDSPAESIS